MLFYKMTFTNRFRTERPDVRELVELRSRGDLEVAVEGDVIGRFFRPIGQFNAQVVPPSVEQRQDVLHSCEREQKRCIYALIFLEFVTFGLKFVKSREFKENV